MLIVLTVVIHLQVYMAKQTTLYTLNTVCHLYLNKVVFKKQKFRLSSPNELESLGMEHRSLCVLKHCCYCSVIKSGPTLCNRMESSMSGFPVLHYLPDFVQAQVH